MMAQAIRCAGVMVAITLGCGVEGSSSSEFPRIVDGGGDTQLAADVATDRVASLDAPSAKDVNTQTDANSQKDGTSQDAIVDSGSSSDAPTDTAPEAETTNARCGAAPYRWIQSPSLGDILEREGVWGHTSLELRLATKKLESDDKLRTDRWPSHGTSAKLIRYQTQDRGKFIDATALVTYPNDDGNYPILLVLHGTSGFHDGCAPSKGAGAGGLNGFTDDVGLMMAMFASYGYIVVFPDYIGLKSMGAPTGFMHPYLIAEPTAIASLDAVRAAKKIFAGGTVPGDVVVIGGSQGGHAAAFVNRYAPHYAPELNIRGSVWDVPPSDMLEQTRAATTSTWVKASDNAIGFLAAADSWYASAPGRLAEVLLPPYPQEVPVRLMGACEGLELENPSLETVYSPWFLQGMKQPHLEGIDPWACYLRENSLSRTSIPRADNIPSLFLLGEMDNLVNNAVERQAFVDLCAQGMALQYLECAGASHTKPLVWAYDQVLDFLEARLRGEPMPAHTCQVLPAERCTSQP